MAKNNYEEAIKHYNKALFAMKMVFDNEKNLIKDRDDSLKFIREIEIPICLNLGLCYLKTN